MLSILSVWRIMYEQHNKQMKLKSRLSDTFRRINNVINVIKKKKNVRYKRDE